MSVNLQRTAFALGLPSGFYEFYLYSRNSILLTVTLEYSLPVQSQIETGFLLKKHRSKPPACPLRPVIGNNACPPRITAAAGTELAGTYSAIMS